MSDPVLDELAVRIGARIRAFRYEHGLTQTELAERTGIMRQQIGRYESGDDLPSLPNAMILAKFMDILVDELLYGSQGEDIRISDPYLRERFVIIDRMKSELRHAACDFMDIFITSSLQGAKESQK
ncbi:MAG TPA: helix-turn-helix transcriptional regulator [Thermoanaerobaculia bacterium]|jgi:transcriptional regulator with XRE-family HTH domain|nr:helix-turn-helix transcriptional regulator [Thermoanaerobaculia bacterium]